MAPSRLIPGLKRPRTASGGPALDSPTWPSSPTMPNLSPNNSQPLGVGVSWSETDMRQKGKGRAVEPEISGQDWRMRSDPFASSSSAYDRLSNTQIRPISRGNVTTTASTSQGQESRRSRTSFLHNASDSLFGRTKSASRRVTAPERPNSDSREDHMPIVDIARRNSVEENEEIERGRLRDAAARSIGIATYPSTIHVPEDAEEDDREWHSATPTPTSPTSLVHLTPYTNGNARPKSRPGTAEHRRVPSGDFTSAPSNGDILSAVPRNLTTVHSTRSTRSAHSSIRSVGSSVQNRDRGSQITPSPVSPTRQEAMAPFPCSRSMLNSHIQTSYSLSKFVPSGSAFASLLTSKTSTRNWKPRFLALTSVGPSRRASHHSMRGYTQSYLHVFKGESPQDKEIERIQITETSSAFVPEGDPEIAGRKFVLKIIGSNVLRAGKSSVPSTVEFAWLFQCPDGLVLQHWIASIKNAIIVQRTERSGVHEDYHEDIDLLSSARSQGLKPSPISSSTHASSSVESSRDRIESIKNTPSDLLNGEASAPVRQAASHPSRPSMTANTAVQALKSLFALGVRSEGPKGPSPVVDPPVGRPRASTTIERPLRTFELAQNTSADDSSLPLYGDRAQSSRSRDSRTPLPSPFPPPDPYDPFISVTPSEGSVSGSIPPQLLIGMPITPLVEDSANHMDDIPEGTPENEEQRSPRATRVFTSNSANLERERERESFSRVLSARSYSSAGWGDRPMSPSSVLSLPPPPRSRRATTSNGIRPQSPFPPSSSTSDGASINTLLISSTPRDIKKSPSAGQWDSLENPELNNRSISTETEEEEEIQREVEAHAAVLPTSSSFGHTSPIFGLSATFEGDRSVTDRTRNSSLSSQVNSPSMDYGSVTSLDARESTLDRSNSMSSRLRRSRIESLPRQPTPPLGRLPDLPPPPPLGDYRISRSSAPPAVTLVAPTPLAAVPAKLSEVMSTSSSAQASKRGSMASSLYSSANSQMSANSASGSRRLSNVASSSNRSSNAHPYTSQWNRSPTASEFSHSHPFASPSSLSFGVEEPSLPPSHRSSLVPQGESSRRQSRTSLMPPVHPPPQGALPLPPRIHDSDEPSSSISPSSKRERIGSLRSGSMNHHSLTTIPGSPATREQTLPLMTDVHIRFGPAAPPPTSPLPLPPSFSTTTLGENQSHVGRHSSLKNRLRRMSAPTKILIPKPSIPSVDIEPPSPPSPGPDIRASRRATVEYNGTIIISHDPRMFASTPSPREPAHFTSAGPPVPTLFRPSPAESSIARPTSTPPSTNEDDIPFFRGLSPPPSRTRSSARRFYELSSLREVPSLDFNSAIAMQQPAVNDSNCLTESRSMINPEITST